MNGIDYDNRLHANYHPGRALDETVMRLWRTTMRRFVGNRKGLTILDLGAGTGRFASVLADEFDSFVVGVEPSDKMRGVAEAQNQHPKVRFLRGAAERIPISDSSCDAAWLSRIVHHLNDLDGAASELRRVVRGPGPVIIRNNFKGRLDGYCPFYQFFPAALAADEARHPTIEHIENCFRRHGFRIAARETIEHMEARDLEHYAQRIRLRTYSSFELMSEAEFESGMRAMQKAARTEIGTRPVWARTDLLVFDQPP